MRLLKGKALYTSNFTVPSPPLGLYTETSGNSSSNNDSNNIIQIVEISSTGIDTITFDSIPQTSENLCIKYIARVDSTFSGLESLRVVINDDSTNSNYKLRQKYNQNGSFSSYSDEGSSGNARNVGSITRGGASANIFSQGEIKLSHYRAPVYKILRVEIDAPYDSNSYLFGESFLIWSNTSAISKIVLQLGSETFAIDSKFILYQM